MSVIGSQKNQCYTFTRDLRLISAADFDRVFSNAKRTGNRHFTVLLKPSAKQTARIGFAVSRKAIKHAVKRNLVKRKVRELFRHNQHTLPQVDIVFIAKKSLSQIDRHELDSSLSKLWPRILQECKSC